MDEIRIPWPEWKTIRKIGKGGYGTVYEITRTDKFGMEEHAAMKVIHFPQDETENRTLLAEGYDKDSITAYNRERLEKVINEYAMMMQMKGHRNIVRCDDCETVAHEDGMGWDVFIRMELLTSLHTRLKERELSQAEVIELGKDLCQALMLCEEKKIVHRDIKPENIFVNEYGDYKLGDFGISRTMEHTTSATRTGSPRFMAPEVYKDQKYGPSVDIYSLGLVMYWLLNNYRMPFLPTDRPPTLSENEEALQKRMAGEEDLPAPVRGSEELKRVVLKACSYATRDRYATAEKYYTALVSIDATEDAKGKTAAVERISDTDETEAVVWKKEKEAPFDNKQKNDVSEDEANKTSSAFDNITCKEETDSNLNTTQAVFNGINQKKKMEIAEDVHKDVEPRWSKNDFIASRVKRKENNKGDLQKDYKSDKKRINLRIKSVFIIAVIFVVTMGLLFVVSTRNRNNSFSSNSVVIKTIKPLFGEYNEGNIIYNDYFCKCTTVDSKEIYAIVPEYLYRMYISGSVSMRTSEVFAGPTESLPVPIVLSGNVSSIKDWESSLAEVSVNGSVTDKADWVSELTKKAKTKGVILVDKLENEQGKNLSFTNRSDLFIERSNFYDVGDSKKFEMYSIHPITVFQTHDQKELILCHCDVFRRWNMWVVISRESFENHFGVLESKDNNKVSANEYVLTSEITFYGTINHLSEVMEDIPEHINIDKVLVIESIIN